MPKYENRQKHPRVKTDILIEAKLVRKLMFRARVRNLSQGGAFLETREKLLPQSEIILFLTLDLKGKKKPCMVQGKVVWANSQSKGGAVGCGIAFADVSSSVARFIHDFVEQRRGKVTALGETDKPKKPRSPTRGQLRG